MVWGRSFLRPHDAFTVSFIKTYRNKEWVDLVRFVDEISINPSGICIPNRLDPLIRLDGTQFLVDLEVTS